MNIIDTRSNIKPRDCKEDFIKNIPLFETRGIKYSLSSNDFTDVIFQSVSSVEFFEEKEQLINKNIYSMGPSTKNFLSQKGFDSICPDIPGSKELIKILSKNDNNKFLIVKGADGLNDVFNDLNENQNCVEEILCYERVKFDNYDNLKKPFLNADAVIFSSTYAVEVFFHEIFSGEMNAAFFGISNRIIKFISDFGYEAKFIDYFSEDISKSIKKSI